MQMEDKPMNIYQKLVEVRKTVPYLKKESKGHQYNYVGSSQVLASVRQKMDELGLLLIPSVVSKEIHVDGKSILTELEMEFTWVNADNPEETITRKWYAQGIDISGEKGVGKAYTYAEKYFLLKSFNIATDKDDPDAFQSAHKNESGTTETKPQLEGVASKAQMTAINSAIKSLGLTKASYIALVEQTVGHKNYTNLTKSEADKMIQILGDYPKEGAAVAQ